MARTLRDCPKCGGSKVELAKGTWLDEPVAVVRCESCGINLRRMGKTIHAAKGLAIRDWNERVSNGRRIGEKNRSG
jgi:hypothetical protein